MGYRKLGQSVNTQLRVIMALKVKYDKILGVLREEEQSGTEGPDLTPYLKKDGSVELNPGYIPSSDNSLVNKKYVDDSIVLSGGYNDERAMDATGSMVTENTEDGITVTYDEDNKKLNFEVEKQTDNNFTNDDKLKLDNIAANANNYSLPIATETTLGGIKIGERLTITAEGILSANEQGGDINNAAVTFTEAETKVNIDSEESVPTLFGKIKKWFSSFGSLAWKSSVDYGSEVTGKPTIPSNFDDLSDGVNNKAFTATEKTKLSGIAAGATANDTDTNLKNRANHTGEQAIETITGLSDALAAKATINSPVFTGAPKAPTPEATDNSTNVATTAFVKALIDILLGGVGSEGDTLFELYTQILQNGDAVSALNSAIGTKLNKSFDNIEDAAQSRTALGLGTVALLNAIAMSDVTGLVSALAAKAASADLTSHTGNISNPHGVTKAQIGLGAVENKALSTWAGSTNLKTVGFTYKGYAQKTPVSGNITFSFADTDPILFYSAISSETGINLIFNMTNCMYGKKVTWILYGGFITFPINSGVSPVPLYAYEAPSTDIAGFYKITFECTHLLIPEAYEGIGIIIEIIPIV